MTAVCNPIIYNLHVKHTPTTAACGCLISMQLPLRIIVLHNSALFSVEYSLERSANFDDQVLRNSRLKPLSGWPKRTVCVYVCVVCLLRRPGHAE